MIEGCLASGWDDPVPASHHTRWFRGHTPLFLQEKKDYSAEMRWKYGDLLDYLAGLSTYAKLPNMKFNHSARKSVQIKNKEFLATFCRYMWSQIRRFALMDREVRMRTNIFL